MEILDNKLHAKNPEYIVWPAAGMQKVDVAFYNEIPDPLPDLKFSGYPISIQFNPSKANKVNIQKVTIAYKDDSQWIPIKKKREINEKTDPHKKFSSLEFAWFPLDKLKAGTQYRVTINAQIDGQAKKIQWKFKTKPLLSFSS